ncbi:MAG: DNA repair protein RecO [Acutalibacteraceae bacterium]|nr:DNA repair protein RecO [Acutalibacteraceae bacterium]
MKFKTDGLILKQTQVGESDRLVTVLTRNMGVIRAFVRGAAKPKNKNSSSTAMLVYSQLSVYKTKDSYIIDEAIPEELFFNLRFDIAKLSLAQYFCEAAIVFAVEGVESEQILRLMLNCIHIIEKDLRPLEMVKAIFELRLVTECGYAPDLKACSVCNNDNAANYYLKINEGCIVCENCDKNGVLLPNGVLSAMRHIVYCDFSKLFNFELKDGNYKQLSNITEYYLLNQVGHHFIALDFYKNLPE